MSAAGKFEDQFAIQQLPAKASGKLLPYSGAPTAIFARNRDYLKCFHVIANPRSASPILWAGSAQWSRAHSKEP
jgi:hypothetical protein